MQIHALAWGAGLVIALVLVSARGAAQDAPAAEAKAEIPYRSLDRAVRESSRGKVRSDIEAMRRKLCKGHERERRIFYHVTVSNHWDYYWLCSDGKAHRAQSVSGATRLHRWIQDFRRQAGVHAGECVAGSKKKVLTGTHEAGVQATAFCDGWIEVVLADGEKLELRFPLAMGKTPRQGGPDSFRFETAADQPASAPPPCPSIKNVCSDVCNRTYVKCRSLVPQTALCRQIAEHCAAECGKGPSVP